MNVGYGMQCAWVTEDGMNVGYGMQCAWVTEDGFSCVIFDFDPLVINGKPVQRHGITSVLHLHKSVET